MLTYWQNSCVPRDKQRTGHREPANTVKVLPAIVEETEICNMKWPINKEIHIFFSVRWRGMYRRGQDTATEFDPVWVCYCVRKEVAFFGFVMFETCSGRKKLRYAYLLY
jgi:hypothetical protein